MQCYQDFYTRTYLGSIIGVLICESQAVFHILTAILVFSTFFVPERFSVNRNRSKKLVIKLKIWLKPYNLKTIIDPLIFRALKSFDHSCKSKLRTSFHVNFSIWILNLTITLTSSIDTVWKCVKSTQLLYQLLSNFLKNAEIYI